MEIFLICCSVWSLCAFLFTLRALINTENALKREHRKLLVARGALAHLLVKANFVPMSLYPTNKDLTVFDSKDLKHFLQLMLDETKDKS